MVKEFKATCPVSKWSGRRVERANGTSCYTFSPFYKGPLTVDAINRKLAEYQTYYSTCRPHGGIGLLTPMAYYRQFTHRP